MKKPGPKFIRGLRKNLRKKKLQEKEENKKKNGIFWSKLDLIFIGFHTKKLYEKKSMFWAIFIWLKPQDLRQLTVGLQGFNKNKF